MAGVDDLLLSFVLYGCDLVLFAYALLLLIVSAGVFVGTFQILTRLGLWIQSRWSCLEYFCVELTIFFILSNDKAGCAYFYS